MPCIGMTGQCEAHQQWEKWRDGRMVASISREMLSRIPKDPEDPDRQAIIWPLLLA